MNPSDQIEAIVARAVTTLRTVEARHRARDTADVSWRVADENSRVDDRDDDERRDDEPDDAPRDRVLGPAEIAALSAAADG